jgi:hypothetical protein
MCWYVCKALAFIRHTKHTACLTSWRVMTSPWRHGSLPFTSHKSYGRLSPASRPPAIEQANMCWYVCKALAFKNTGKDHVLNKLACNDVIIARHDVAMTTS